MLRLITGYGCVVVGTVREAKEIGIRSCFFYELGITINTGFLDYASEYTYDNSTIVAFQRRGYIVVGCVELMQAQNSR